MDGFASAHGSEIGSDVPNIEDVSTLNASSEEEKARLKAAMLHSAADKRHSDVGELTPLNTTDIVGPSPTSADPASLFFTPHLEVRALPEKEVSFLNSNLTDLATAPKSAIDIQPSKHMARHHTARGPLSDSELDYYNHQESQQTAFSHPNKRPEFPEALTDAFGAKSDTEVEYEDPAAKKSNQDTALSLQDPTWHWSWGGLPEFGAHDSQGDDGHMNYDEKVEMFLAGLENSAASPGSPEFSASPSRSGSIAVESFLGSVEISQCDLKAIRDASKVRNNAFPLN